MKTRKHPTLPNGQPAISCFSLSWDELKRRNGLAHDRVTAALKEAQAEEAIPEHEMYDRLLQIGRRTLWHTDFPAGLKLQVCDKELFEVAARLELDLVDANAGEPLDFWDYGYVADLLRELLNQRTLPKGDRACLKRALALVELQGNVLGGYGKENYA